MKKTLLFLASVLFAVSAVSAQVVSEPIAAPGYVITKISPNGKYAAGCDPYAYVVYCINLENMTLVYYEPENESEMCDLGSGRCVSDNGIVLFTKDYNGTASYIENEEVKDLPLPEGITSAFAQSITPDGSRIAGMIGIPPSIDADVVMQRPVIWNRNADGTYSDPIELPYPTKDFTGLLPQYVLVGDISDDGKTIACELHDYIGVIDQPLVLKEGADGTWSYDLFAAEYINPLGIELPEYPGECPEATDYMTEEELAAYEQALKDAENAVEPDVTDYMTDEEKAAYNEALEGGGWIWYGDYMTEEERAAYNDALSAYYEIKYPRADSFLSEEALERYYADCEEWDENYWQYYMAYFDIQESGANFVMNSHTMSPNGKYYAVAGMPSDPETWTETYKTYVFNLDKLTASGIMTGENGASAYPTAILNDGRVLAYRPASWTDNTSLAYFAPGIGEEFIPLQELVANDADLYAWMEEEMYHEFTTWIWDEDLEEDVEETTNSWVIGCPCCDAEMNTIITWTTNNWDREDDAPYFYSYIIPMNGTTGIEIISADEKNANAEYFDLQGMRVLSPKKGSVVIRRQGSEVKKVIL